MDKLKTARLLERTSLFAHMSQAEVVFLLDCFLPRTLSLEKGQVFCLAGDSIDGVYVVLEGQLLAFMEAADGSRLIRDQFASEDVFGELAAFSPQRIWPVTIQAKTACRLLFLSREQIVGRCQRGCRGHNQLVYNVLEMMAEKAMRMNEQMGLISFGNLRRKVASLMLARHQAVGGGPFLLEMKIHETADYLGVARPSLSREISRMKKEGLIGGAGRRFWIIDLDKLESLAGE